MAYDSALPVNAEMAAPTVDVVVRSDFRRTERLVLLAGASGLGAALGFGAAIAAGRIELWLVILAAMPFLVFALHLTAETLRDALKRNAYGCAAASIMHAGALLAWPLSSLFIPLGALNYFVPPAAALATLVLFASCWGGSSRAVYRMGAQGALVAAVAAHQGFMVLLA